MEVDILNRSLVGIRLPSELQAGIAEVQKQLRWRAGGEAVRWTPPEEMVLHLTALGEVSANVLIRAKQALEPLISRCPPLHLKIEGVGGAPTVLQPRIVFANVTGDLVTLEQLHNAVEAVLTPIVPDHEVRPFEPRIILGRLKKQEEADRTALGRALKIASVGEVGFWTATEAELIRSVGTTAGPTLVTEATYPFKGAPRPIQP